MLLGLTACAGFAADGDTAAAPAAAAVPASNPDMWQQIQAEIGDAACDTSDQCHTLPVGHKACGGPERYVAWSSKTSDGAKLAQLASEYAAARKAENARGGMLSNCMLERDPGASCNAKRCVLRKNGTGVSTQ